MKTEYLAKFNKINTQIEGLEEKIEDLKKQRDACSPEYAIFSQLKMTNLEDVQVGECFVRSDQLWRVTERRSQNYDYPVVAEKVPHGTTNTFTYSATVFVAKPKEEQDA